MIISKATEKDIEQIKKMSDYQIAVIKDERDYQKADEFLTEIKRLLKQINEKRKDMTRPLDESKKNIMDYFRPAVDKLTDMEKATKTIMGNYTALQLKIIADEEAGKREVEETARIIAEKLEKTKVGTKTYEKLQVKMDKAVETYLAPATQKVKNTRIDHDFEIVDESKVPDTYKMLDLVKIGKVVRATAGKCVIPGVRVIETITIIGRT